MVLYAKQTRTKDILKGKNILENIYLAKRRKTNQTLLGYYLSQKLYISHLAAEESQEPMELYLRKSSSP